jgi:hypothetical protein
MIGQSTAELATARARYEKLYLRYRSYGRDARRLVELADEGSTDEMVRLWKSIDPIAVNEAFAFVKGELEWTDKITVGEGPIPRGAERLRSAYGREFGFELDALSKSKPKGERELTREFSNSLVEDAAHAAGCRCQGDGMELLAPSEMNRLQTALTDAGADMTTLVVPKMDGTPRFTKFETFKAAVKVSPEHREPHAWGGTSAANNLVVVCPGCNFSRINWDLDTIGVADYAYR